MPMLETENNGWFKGPGWESNSGTNFGTIVDHYVDFLHGSLCLTSVQTVSHKTDIFLLSTFFSFCAFFGHNLSYDEQHYL